MRNNAAKPAKNSQQISPQSNREGCPYNRGIMQQNPIIL
jgi:hypothetical protein